MPPPGTSHSISVSLLRMRWSQAAHRRPRPSPYQVDQAVLARQVARAHQILDADAERVDVGHPAILRSLRRAQRREAGVRDPRRSVDPGHDPAAGRAPRAVIGSTTCPSKPAARALVDVQRLSGPLTATARIRRKRGSLRSRRMNPNPSRPGVSSIAEDQVRPSLADEVVGLVDVRRPSHVHAERADERRDRAIAPSRRSRLRGPRCPWAVPGLPSRRPGHRRRSWAILCRAESASGRRGVP